MSEELGTLVGFDVSRETEKDLRRFADLVLKWNRQINLIARSSKAQIWNRHIKNSMLGYSAIKDRRGPWLDFGSGAGFPAVVLALLWRNKCDSQKVICIEADQRKCEFLRAVSRELELDLMVVAKRIEHLEPQNARIITTRALSPLPKLLGYCARHLLKEGRALIYKGHNWATEVSESQRSWAFSYEIAASEVSTGSVILNVGYISRV